MRYFLENEYLKAEFESFGAELKSLKTKNDNQEYMWCADPAYWGKTSPFLFPFIGKTVNMEYKYNGKVWPSEKHGFGQRVPYEMVKQTEDTIVFRIKDTAETYEKYPFRFTLDIEYKLCGETIVENWYVTNNGENTMYFSIGGHAAYACPLNGHGRTGKKIKLYGAEGRETITSLRVNEQGLVTEEKLVLPLENAMVTIDQHTFDHDALVFADDGITEIGLCDENGVEYVRVECTCPVWGVWSMPDNNASYVCIEPWYGICDFIGFDGEISQRPYINSVEPGQTWTGGNTTKVAGALK